MLQHPFILKFPVTLSFPFMKSSSPDTLNQLQPSEDPNASNRKRDHIALALDSQVSQTDPRFYYEPLLSAHPTGAAIPKSTFGGKEMRAPIWISSMTGGTQWAGTINRNLAKAAAAFGLGMGLGSCRQLLYDKTYFEDFALRKLIGDQPFYANLGIAQVAQLLKDGEAHRISQLLNDLEADGLILHVNPLQEWLQPEGDAITEAPLVTIHRLLDIARYPVIVKEVGQGMGPESLKALLQLPLQAIDFASHGGTNFALLELHRSNETEQKAFAPIAHVGHTAAEMVSWINQEVHELGEKVRCKEYIVSGGIKNYLDGYYHIRKMPHTAIYGQASALLTSAQESYEALEAYLHAQIKGLQMAYTYLRPR